MGPQRPQIPQASLLPFFCPHTSCYPCPCHLPLIRLVSQSSKPTATHKMITPTDHTVKALQQNGSPDNSRRSPRAEDQMMLATIRRRPRPVIDSPRWLLAMLICTMLFVGSSSSANRNIPKKLFVSGAGDERANGIYEYAYKSGSPCQYEMPMYYKYGFERFSISFPCSDEHRSRGWSISDTREILYNVPLTKDQKGDHIDRNALGYPPKTGWKIYEGEPDALTVVPADHCPVCKNKKGKPKINDGDGKRLQDNCERCKKTGIVNDCEWDVAKLLPPYVPTVDPSSIHRHRLLASEAAGHA